MSLEPAVLLTGGLQILILLLAISLHESAHAWMADRLGDPTARNLGRVSLNPLRHLDPFGSILLPLLLILMKAPVFGWAKPTPVLLRNLKRPRRDDLLVSAAGPVSNFLLAAAATVALAIAVRWLGEEARQVALLTLLHEFDRAAELPHFALLFTLVEMAYLNAFLGVFNLLPIPPLDGGHVVLNLLPPVWAQRYAALRPYGFMIVIGLAALGALSVLVLPIYLALALVISL
jgi:Zn-dependent protease